MVLHVKFQSEKVRRFEAALGYVPGSTRVVPQLNATIQYLGTTEAPGNVYVVRVKKLD